VAAEENWASRRRLYTVANIHAHRLVDGAFAAHWRPIADAGPAAAVQF